MHKFFLSLFAFLISINVSVSAQNGNIYPADMEQNVLVEMFTAQTCTNCPLGHSSLASAIEQTGIGVVEIAHHSGFVPDAFSMIEDSVMVDLFNTNATYNPAASFNRLIIGKEKAPTVEPVSISDDVKYLTYASQQKPYVSIALDSKYNPATRDVTLKAQFYTHEQMPDADLRYTAWLVQDKIIGYQKGASNKEKYEHNAVSRGTITDVWGENTDFPVGEITAKELTFNLPESISATYNPNGKGQDIPVVLENIKIIVFVHQIGETIADYQVFNCTEVSIGSSIRMGGFPTDTPSAIKPLKTTNTPSPTYNLAGQQVSHYYKGLKISNGKKHF